MQKLVVFLGNPGVQYKNTRHNAAWMFADTLGIGNWQEKFHSLYARSGDVFFQKPQTFMNLSGQAVQELASFFKISPENILVVHDDIELGFGEAVLRKGGGLAGHNGLRSLKQMLGTDGFWRLRLGVGRPEKQDVASYVLGRFSPVEEKCLGDVFAKASGLLEKYKSGV